MAMILFAFSRLLPIISSLIQSKTNIEGFIPAYEQVKKLSQKAESLQEPRGGIQYKKLEKGIIYKDVSFAYPGKKTAFSDINIFVRKGKMTAIIGSSGVGKTTLVDLMIGLYQPKSGKILLDGINLEDYDLNSFRQSVGFVPQDPQLFNTSIRENLLWSKPEACDKDIWEACRMANAEQFIRELPEKLDTVMGDRGIRLSGGQRQRIALARAIIRKPDLLILDEATSSLDTDSEKKIHESIDNLAKETTIVVIAHRLQTIRNADYIYVLENGKVIEAGTYGTLTKDSTGKLSRMILDQVIV
jgi:ATP-binding cassette subfamily B protein